MLHVHGNIDIIRAILLKYIVTCKLLLSCQTVVYKNLGINKRDNHGFLCFCRLKSGSECHE